MEGQITIDEWLASIPTDFTFDRRGRKTPAPKWLKFKRCENCIRWVRLPEGEQPPDGWGTYGFCQNQKARCSYGSYCQEWEKRTNNEMQ